MKTRLHRPVSSPVSKKSAVLHSQDDSGYMNECETRHFLEQQGFAFPKTCTVTSKREVESAKHFFDSPVALKILSPDIIHKSDVGGVVLNVPPKNIAKEYEKLIKHITKTLPDAKIEGVVLAEMAPKTSQEILLGIKEEPGLGKLIVVGMGGIYVETLADIRSRFAPISIEEAKEMILTLKSAPMLTGGRGQKSVNIDLLAELITALSKLALAHPEIQELDINPLVPAEDGSYLCLDARLRVAPGIK